MAALETILDPGACDPESACFISLRHATGGHEQKSPEVEVAMEFSCRSRDSGDVLAILATEESDENTEKGLSVFAG